MLEELPLDPTESLDVAFLQDERTPAWLVRLACAAHAASASLSECSDLLAWFGVDRTRQTVWYWYQAYGEYHDEEFTAEPDRVAVDEKQVELEGAEKVWLYAAIDVDSKVVLHVQLSKHRGTDPAAEFLRELKEKHRVSDAEFLVDGVGYLTALARTGLDGDLNYSDRNIVEKLFQTVTMRLSRFHEIWNGSQASTECWLTAYTAYYNHLRSHQALDNQPPIKYAKSSGAI